MNPERIIPREKWPVCDSCGKLIERTSKAGKRDDTHRWLSRTVCRKSDDPECSKKYMSKINVGKSRKKTVVKKVEAPRQPKLTEAQRAEMDRQQREIDRAGFMAGIEHYTTLPAVSLPPEEIKRLESIYQPPTGPQRHILPHFQMRTTV